MGRKTALKLQQEEELYKIIDFMAGRGFPLTIHQILAFVYGNYFSFFT